MHNHSNQLLHFNLLNIVNCTGTHQYGISRRYLWSWVTQKRCNMHVSRLWRYLAKPSVGHVRDILAPNGGRQQKIIKLCESTIINKCGVSAKGTLHMPHINDTSRAYVRNRRIQKKEINKYSKMSFGRAPRLRKYIHMWMYTTYELHKEKQKRVYVYWRKLITSWVVVHETCD